MVNGRQQKRYIYTPRKQSQIECVPCKIGILISLGDGGKKYIITDNKKVIFPNGDTVQLATEDDLSFREVMTDVLTMCFAFRDEGWRPPKEDEEDGHSFTLSVKGSISLVPPKFKDGKLVVKRGGLAPGGRTNYPMGGGNRLE